MGVGAALLMPGTLSTITSVFPQEERAKAVGIWAGFATAGGTLGILASGALLEAFYWGSVFVVTAAIALVALVAIILVVPSTRSTEPVRFDPLGSFTSAIGIGLLVLGIIEGPDRGWTDPVTVIGLVGGALFLVGFVLVELRAKTPLLDPRLFAHHGFATGSASLFLQFFAMFAFFFLSLQYLQLVLGYGTLTAAAALLPMTVVIMPIAAMSGTLSERYGHRLVGGAGLAVSALGFGVFAMLGSHSGFLLFLVATLIIGSGAALAMTPATNAIIASLPRDKQGVASAVNDTARAGRRVRRRRPGQRVQHGVSARHRQPPRWAPRRARQAGARGTRDRDPARAEVTEWLRSAQLGARRVHRRYARLGAVRYGDAAPRSALRVDPRRIARRGNHRGRARSRRRPPARRGTRRMTVTFDEATRRLLDGQNFATVATLNPDGAPQTSVVWIKREGDTVVFSTTTGRQKARNLSRDPRIKVVGFAAEPDARRSAEIGGRIGHRADVAGYLRGPPSAYGELQRNPTADHRPPTRTGSGSVPSPPRQGRRRARDLPPQADRRHHHVLGLRRLSLARG